MPGLNGLKFLAANAPHQLVRYGLNWHHQLEYQHHAMSVWEETERGSIVAVMCAYAYVIPLIESKSRFGLEQIQTIHRLCTQNVQLQTANLPQGVSESAAGNFRGFGPWVGTLFGCFGIDKQTSTEKGLLELLDAHAKGDCHCETPYQQNINNPTQIYHAFASPYRYFLVSGYRAGFSWEDLNNLQDKIERENTIIAEQNATIAPPSRLTMGERQYLTYSINAELNRWRANLTHKLETVFATFYAEIDALSDSAMDDKLFAIVRFVQRLERIHPFWDGNLRTFCMVLLNALLMQYGFEPALLENPNQFDGFSVAELVLKVKEGIRRSETLLAYVRESVDSSNQSLITETASYAVPVTHYADYIEYAMPLLTALNQQKIDCVITP